MRIGTVPSAGTRRTGAVLTLAALVAAPLAYAACFDFSTSPDDLLYLTFERLPFPAVVAGDTLRDSTGVKAVLTATAVDGRGDVIPGAPLRFYAVGDTGDVLQVDSTSGEVVSAPAAPQTVRIVATVGSLQSQPLPITITKRPDSLALQLSTDTISYSFTDSTFNFSDPLTVSILHNDSSTFFSGVSSWVVRYTLERATDTVYASLVDDLNRRLKGEPGGLFHIDTTTADGNAARKLRIRPGPPLATPLDSVAVLVEARYKGLHVAGSPARVFVYVRPRVGP